MTQYRYEVVYQNSVNASGIEIQGAVINMPPAPTGPELWAELHTCAHPNQEWLDDWQVRVQSMICNCGEKLTKLFEAHPVRLDDWFAWSVELHNAVNETLGKPQMSINEARRIWNV